MPFSPINLGNIIQQGEAIQGSRLQNLRLSQAMDPNSPTNQLMQLQIESRRLENEALRNPVMGNNVGQVSPKDFKAPSIQTYLQTGDYNDLERHEPNRSAIRVDEGDAWGIYNPVTSQLLRRVPKNLAPKDELDYVEQAASAKTEGTAAVELETKPEIAAAVANSQGQANRGQDWINRATTASEAYPVIGRALQLLDKVETGGIDSVKLAASNFFGVTGADEAELSNNMGKAVLSQLRETFGAAFTVEEGRRLESIEANYGKSTAGNKRLLQQAQKILNEVMKRGLKAADGTGDAAAMEAIQAGYTFDLSIPIETPGQQSDGLSAAEQSELEELMRQKQAGEF